ncbi:MAG: amidohydrolase family protein [Dehalococcoidia bacterium]|nr:amidohydrolase family protein [Dehalococcoidia bacterium]
MSTVIRGGRVIDPAQGIDELTDIAFADGQVVALGRSPGEYDEEIDAEGLAVTPGFIDLHCHLREPGQEHKETIASGTLAAARGGFTTVCAMPNTTPVIDSRSLVESVLASARASASIRVLPIGAVTRGSAGHELAELGDMAAAGAVAFSDDGQPVWDAGLMRRALEYSRALGLLIIDHCEEPALSKGGVMHEGWVSVRLGLPGAPAAAEEAAVARDLQLAELTGARVHIAHVSTAGSVELLRTARARGVEFSTEVTPHHLTLTHEAVMGGAKAAGEALAYDTNARVNPPLRGDQDVAACVAGLVEGVIDCIATDHAPHASEDKVCEFEQAANGISGLETAFGLCHDLVTAGHLTLPVLIERLTAAPARVFGLERFVPGIGTLREGAPADVALIAPEESWSVDPGAMASKGKNTPLAGRTLTGRVVMTMSGGRIVHDSRSPAAEGARQAAGGRRGR